MPDEQVNVEFDVQNNMGSNARLNKFLEMTRDMPAADVAREIGESVKDVARPTFADIAEMQRELEAYQIEQGYTTQEELDQESARLAANDHIHGDDDFLTQKWVPANRAERRAAARAARKR